MQGFQVLGNDLFAFVIYHTSNSFSKIKHLDEIHSATKQDGDSKRNSKVTFLI